MRNYRYPVLAPTPPPPPLWAGLGRRVTPHSQSGGRGGEEPASCQAHRGSALGGVTGEGRRSQADLRARDTRADAHTLTAHVQICRDVETLKETAASAEQPCRVRKGKEARLGGSPSSYSERRGSGEGRGGGERTG